LLVSLWIRTRVDESPEFVEAKAGRRDGPAPRPFRTLLREFKVPSVVGLGLNLTLTGYSYVIQVFSVSYLINELGMSPSLSLAIGATAYGIGMVTVPLFGVLADRVGPVSMFIASNVLSILYVVPFWMLLDTRDPFLGGLAVVIGLPLLMGAQFASQPLLYKMLFPTKVRYSGIAFSRETTGALLGGTAPLIAATLVDGPGDWQLLAGLMAALATLALLSALATARVAVAVAPRSSTLDAVP
jgi:MHS family shikimate/dehydroshikimate transporter-like MFS transporter